VLYNELAFSSATVRYRGEQGAFGFYFVDNEAALVGGWDIWGIEKKLATFEWSAPEDAGVEGDRIRATDANGTLICDMTFPRPGKSGPFKQTPVCFSVKQPGAAYGAAHDGTATVYRTQPQQAFQAGVVKGATVGIPAASPFHPVYSTVTGRPTSLAMGDATFSMGGPEAI
jgi:hypothetical protein